MLSYTISEIMSSDSDDDIEPTNIKEKLLWASEKGLLDMVKDILEKEPTSISFRDEDGYSALHRASYEGQVEIAKILLSQGADIHAKTNDGWTPLHSACKWNESKVSKVLIENGADVNAQSNGLQTPLHLAASCKESEDLLTLLLSQKNIQPTLKNSIGETAYEIARRTDKYCGLFNTIPP